jgi:hypothetical protein
MATAANRLSRPRPLTTFTTTAADRLHDHSR